MGGGGTRDSPPPAQAKATRAVGGGGEQRPFGKGVDQWGDSGACQVDRTRRQGSPWTSSGGGPLWGAGPGDPRGPGCAQCSLEYQAPCTCLTEPGGHKGPGRHRGPWRRPSPPGDRELPLEPSRCVVAMLLQALTLGKPFLSRWLIWFTLNTIFLQILQIRKLSLGEFWQRTRTESEFEPRSPVGPPFLLYRKLLPPPMAPGLRSP